MEPATILAKAEGYDVAGLHKQVAGYLKALLGFINGKENKKNTPEIHRLAKKYVPNFLVPLLKVCCNNLTKGISETDELSQNRADELFKTLKLALDCLEALRPCLVGSPYEIETQRYWMVRRLMAWKRFTEAREECWNTLDKLKRNLFPAAKEKDKYGVNLYGEQAAGSDPSLAGLILGLVMDLIICIGESRPKDAEVLEKVPLLVDQLTPWRRVLDNNSAEKHNSMLFKGLQKCIEFMAKEPSNFNPKLIRNISVLALKNCACSSVKDQFINVTCRICHQLASGGSQLSSTVDNIYKVALIILFKDGQLFGEYEALKVIEYYFRYCEANPKLRKDAKQFLNGIADNLGQGSTFPLAAVLHIYAISLGFEDIEVSGSCNDDAIYIEDDVSEAPKIPIHVENQDSVLLSNSVQIIQTTIEKFKWRSGELVVQRHGNNVALCDGKSKSYEVSNNNQKCIGGSLISISKALEFLWKVFSGYVQQEWDIFIASSTTIKASVWHPSLEKAFHLFTQVFIVGFSSNFVSVEEKKELRKVCQTLLLAASAALKLSLMHQEAVQECFETISTLISGSWIEVKELKWLISYMYNIGVAMFNMKQYDGACGPLKLAYKAAWTRVSLLKNLSSDESTASGFGCSMSDNISESVSDACGKSVVLVDALQRSGRKEARENITDCLLQWTKVDTQLSSPNNLRSLVKLWVKMVCADYKEIDIDEASVQSLTLYKVLSSNGCSLPMGTLGTLLEEELLAYSKIETELSRFMRKGILELLLDDVYVAKEFSLERSRVLLEQTKIDRLSGAAGLGRCMDCLSDAILLLRNVLNEDYNPNGNSSFLDRVRHQLAITYCVHAICTQEANANSEVICDDISLAMKLWEQIDSFQCLELNGEKDWLTDTSIPLLLNMLELLALKGFTYLQSKLQELVLTIFKSWKKMGSEECCALLWRENRLSHALCCVSFSQKSLSILMEKFGIAVNSINFWENCVKDNPGSVLEFQQKLMYDEFLEVQSDRGLETSSLSSSGCTIEVLKERALTLVSNGLKTRESAFLASSMFYMLSKKYRRKGQLLAALRYSKEALLIRTKVLHRKFKFLDKKSIQVARDNSAEFKNESNEVGGIYLEALGSVTTNVWPTFSDAEKDGEYWPSQWVVLGNYLENLMQVGVLCEMVGDGDEAENIFQEGLKISNAQDLPLGQAAFGSCLGEIYRKRHSWEKAEEILKNAKQVFHRQDLKLVCKLCQVTVEATLDMRIGDLVRRCPKEKTNVHFPENPTSAIDVYTLARENLCKEMSKAQLAESLGYTAIDVKKKRGTGQRGQKSSRRVDLDESIIEVRDYLKDSESTCRKTRSRSKAGNNCDLVVEGTEHLSLSKTPRQSTGSLIARDDIDKTSYSLRKKTQHKPRSVAHIGSRNNSEELSHDKDCSGLCEIERDKVHSMQELIAFCWECHTRSVLSRLLLQIGKCYKASEELHKVHEIFLQNISLLFFHNGRSPCLCSFGTAHCCQLECSGKRNPVDIFLIERAALLYHISWLSLSKIDCSLSWMQCCKFAENQTSLVLGWLQHAFFICSQMPALFQKVSMLLAILHLPLESGGLFSLPMRHGSNLSTSHWAAYFHQASLGTALRQQHLIVLDSKLESLASDSEEHHHSSKDVITRVQQALRLIPETVEDLEHFVTDFFKNVPLSTIICVSLLDSKHVSLLGDLPFNNSSPAWMFLTRFGSKGQPVVLLLPILSNFEGSSKDDAGGSMVSCPYTIDLDCEDSEGNDIDSSSEAKKLIYGSSKTVVDLVAEEFGLVLEESRLSTSNSLPVPSNEDKCRWWQWRIELDKRLAKLLRGIEDSWFGPWKCFLLGEPLEATINNAVDARIQDVKQMLGLAATSAGVETHVPVDEGLLKVLLAGSTSLRYNEIEKGVSCLLWRNFNILQSYGSDNLERSQREEIVGKAAKALSSVFQNSEADKIADQKVHNNEPGMSLHQEKQEDFTGSNMTYIQREPVVLVLDANSQVLPWESLPILRKHEVYRMPSVSSILAVMASRFNADSVDVFDKGEKTMLKGRKNTKQERSSRKTIKSSILEQPARLPIVDPYNTFYLLNPSGDLGSTQAAFEDWFKNQKGWEGKMGVVPSPEECISALQKHDLFIYFGHGSGEQYLSGRNIRRLDHCAAAVLMGCSSGRLSCRGDYEPVGVPLSYLIAGCPSIIANLWDVTDGDIDRFSRILLNGWLESVSSHCSELEMLEEFQNLTIAGHKGAKKVKEPMQKGKDDEVQSMQVKQAVSEKVFDISRRPKSTRGTVRTGSFIGEGRSTCRLPYLIGASPVCYGVPTTIKTKRTSV
jgi:separase